MDRISIRLFVMCIPSAGHSPRPRSSFWLIEDLRTDGTATGCTDNSYRCGVLLAAPVRNRRIASRLQLHQNHRSSGPLLHTFQKSENQQILLIKLREKIFLTYPLWPNVQYYCVRLYTGNVTDLRLTPGNSPQPKVPRHRPFWPRRL